MPPGPLDTGAVHALLGPGAVLWAALFTAVPAVSTPDISRSHFQAQDCLERGGAASGTTEGWLDRVLDRLEESPRVVLWIAVAVARADHGRRRRR